MEREYRKFRKEEKGRSIRNVIFCKTGHIGLEEKEGAKACTEGSNSGKDWKRKFQRKRNDRNCVQGIGAGNTEKRERKFCVKIERRK